MNLYKDLLQLCYYDRFKNDLIQNDRVKSDYNAVFKQSQYNWFSMQINGPYQMRGFSIIP